MDARKSFSINDLNNAKDVYTKNLTSGIYTLVSTNSNGVVGNAGSYDPKFSPDASKVVFESIATNLVSDDTNEKIDIFLKNLETNKTIRLSTNSLGEEGNGESHSAVFSPDGIHVAFVSNSSNLVSDDDNGVQDLFIKNIVTGEIVRITEGVNGAYPHNLAAEPRLSFSPDGSKIAATIGDSVFIFTLDLPEVHLETECIDLKLADGDLVGGLFIPSEEFQVNTYTENRQDRPSVASLSDGGFVVTWQSNGQDGSGSGIYGQLYNADGTTNGGEFQVNSHTIGNQAFPAVAALEYGGFVVIWLHPYDGIFGQLYNADGSTKGSQFQVETSGSSHYVPSITGLSDGGFVITWTSEGHQEGGVYSEEWNISFSDIFGQRFNADGSTNGDEFLINTSTDNEQYGSTVSSLSDGGFIVTWFSEQHPDSEEFDNFGHDIFGQRYNPDGTTKGGEFQIDTGGVWPSVVGLTNGGYVVTWQSEGLEDSVIEIFGQRYNPDGTTNGNKFQVSTNSNIVRDPVVAELSDGGFVISWADSGEIFGQRYNPDGSAYGDEFTINSYVLGNQSMPSISSLSDGGFVASWQSDGQDGDNFGVFAKIISPISNFIIEGSNGDDLLFGDENNNIIFGFAGNDTLKGYEGDDCLNGGKDSDILWGNNGDDILNGGIGSDWLKGGNGLDTYVLDNLEGVDTIADFRTNELIDVKELLCGVLGFIPNRAFLDGFLRLEQVNADTYLYIDQDGSAGANPEELLAILLDWQASKVGLSNFILPSLTNTPPVAVDDEFTGDQDVSILGNVLADNGSGADFDPDGDPLTVISGTYATANGSITLAKYGTFSYTPNAGFHGTDTFEYTLEDGQGGSDKALVSFIINPINQEPIAQDDYFTGLEDNLILGNVLADNGNGTDSDPDGDLLTVTPVTMTTAMGGTVVLEADGDFTYTPQKNFHGNDSFDYTIGDGHGGEDQGTVYLAIDKAMPPSYPDISGGKGDDLLIGTENNDTLKGRQGNDILLGNGGDDTIWGNNGNDILYGGVGSDWMKGGNGADLFVLDGASNQVDTIFDLRISKGDALQIKDILSFDPLNDAISDFVKITQSTGNSVLSVDIDGSGTAFDFVDVASIKSIIGLNVDDLYNDGDLIISDVIALS